MVGFLLMYLNDRATILAFTGRLPSSDPRLHLQNVKLNWANFSVQVGITCARVLNLSCLYGLLPAHATLPYFSQCTDPLRPPSCHRHRHQGRYFCGQCLYPLIPIVVWLAFSYSPKKSPKALKWPWTHHHPLWTLSKEAAPCAKDGVPWFPAAGLCLCVRSVHLLP